MDTLIGPIAMDNVRGAAFWLLLPITRIVRMVLGGTIRVRFGRSMATVLPIMMDTG